MTGTDIHFFGLEVELWQIGDSAMAPKFNVICQPNDWQKVAAASAKTGVTGRQSLQLKFWMGFKTHLEANSQILTPRKPYPQNWMYFPLGRSGISSAAVASLWNNSESTWNKHELRAEITFEGKAKDYYPQIESQRTHIETQFGQKLDWNTDGKIYRIRLLRDADLEDESQWPQYFVWLQEHLEQLNKTFRPLIGQLTAPE